MKKKPLKIKKNKFKEKKYPISKKNNPEPFSFNLKYKTLKF